MFFLSYRYIFLVIKSSASTSISENSFIIGFSEAIRLMKIVLLFKSNYLDKESGTNLLIFLNYLS